MAVTTAAESELMAHSLPTSLRGVTGCGGKSQAMWSESPNGSAIVFVHGFCGSAVKTWDEFPRLLGDERTLNGHDFFYYGYDSVFTQIPISAAGFRDFLIAMLEDPYRKIARLVLPKALLNRKPTFAYQKVLVVAHSLGAVVARLALLDLTRIANCKEYLNRIEMALVAPAHHGANVLELGLAALGPWLALAAPLQFLSPPLKELQAQSLTITQLQRATQSVLADSTHANSHSALIAKLVAHGTRDRVVNTNTFCNDPPINAIAGVGHIAICKPNAVTDKIFSMIREIA